jgi:hypothetical protein
LEDKPYSDDVRGEMPEYIVEGQLQVCSNTWFIGTANNDDSTQMITDKVYDRAIVLNFKKREDAFKAPKTVPIHLSNAEFKLLYQEQKVTQDDMEKFRILLTNLMNICRHILKYSFGNRISKQIGLFVPAYMACGGSVYEAIDVIFSTKVLRNSRTL